MKFGFFVIRIYHEILRHMLKPTVPKFRPNQFAHLKEIDEKQVSVKLKPRVGVRDKTMGAL